MELDGMARQEGSSGLRWFNNIDVLAVTIRGRAMLEAQNITKWGQHDAAFPYSL
jgi:hypothetical protein